MNADETTRPDFEAMSKAHLIKILDDIRESLASCEDARDFCLSVAEILNVDTRASG